MMPILPFINDTQENILEIIRLAKENGASFIFPSFGVTMRANQRDHFYEKIDTLFPGIKDKYIRAFGGEYSCNSGRLKELRSLFINECNAENHI